MMATKEAESKLDIQEGIAPELDIQEGAITESPKKSPFKQFLESPQARFGGQALAPISPPASTISALATMPEGARDLILKNAPFLGALIPGPISIPAAGVGEIARQAYEGEPLNIKRAGTEMATTGLGFGIGLGAGKLAGAVAPIVGGIVSPIASKFGGVVTGIGRKGFEKAIKKPAIIAAANLSKKLNLVKVGALAENTIKIAQQHLDDLGQQVGLIRAKMTGIPYDYKKAQGIYNAFKADVAKTSRTAPKMPALLSEFGDKIKLASDGKMTMEEVDLLRDNLLDNFIKWTKSQEGKAFSAWDDVAIRTRNLIRDSLRDFPGYDDAATAFYNAKNKLDPITNRTVNNMRSILTSWDKLPPDIKRQMMNANHYLSEAGKFVSKAKSLNLASKFGQTQSLNQMIKNIGIGGAVAAGIGSITYNPALTAGLVAPFIAQSPRIWAEGIKAVQRPLSPTLLNIASQLGVRQIRDTKVPEELVK